MTHTKITYTLNKTKTADGKYVICAFVDGKRHSAADYLVDNWEIAQLTLLAAKYRQSFGYEFRLPY